MTNINSEGTRRPLELAIVLLAAGPSSRLGQPKQLVQHEGESLVRRSARIFLGLEPVNLTVVTGFQAEAVSSELHDLPLEIVFNKEWGQGMGSSINRGVRSLRSSPDGVLVAVCDQWRLLPEDLQRLHAQWQSDVSRICVASWREGDAFISGPPAIFPRKLIPELKSMQASRGARQLIDRFMDIVDFVEIDNAAFDLDRPEDLKRL